MAPDNFREKPGSTYDTRKEYLIIGLDIEEVQLCVPTWTKDLAQAFDNAHDTNRPDSLQT
jgi:hypothetical protein